MRDNRQWWKKLLDKWRFSLPETVECSPLLRLFEKMLADRFPGGTLISYMMPQKSCRWYLTYHMDNETREKLLRRRGYERRRVSQIGHHRWVAEYRLNGKWRTLCDEDLRFRIFTTVEEALEASEADRLEMEAMWRGLEEKS